MSIKYFNPPYIQQLGIKYQLNCVFHSLHLNPSFVDFDCLEILTGEAETDAGRLRECYYLCSGGDSIAGHFNKGKMIGLKNLLLYWKAQQ